MLLFFIIGLLFGDLFLTKVKSVGWCEFFEEFNHFILERLYIDDIPHCEHVIFLYIVQVCLIHKFKGLLSLLIGADWGDGDDLEPIYGIILVELVLLCLVVSEHRLLRRINLVDQGVDWLWHAHQVLDSMGLL